MQGFAVLIGCFMHSLKNRTHCAGTIGGVGNNTVGVTGVNWNVKMVTGKFLGPGGGYTSGAIEAVNYMVALKTRANDPVNIRVLSNSWGGGELRIHPHIVFARHRVNLHRLMPALRRIRFVPHLLKTQAAIARPWRPRSMPRVMPTCCLSPQPATPTLTMTRAATTPRGTCAIMAERAATTASYP